MRYFLLAATVVAGCNVEPSTDHFDAVMATGVMVNERWPRAVPVQRWGVHLVPASEEGRWRWCAHREDAVTRPFGAFPFDYDVSIRSSFDTGGAQTFSAWRVLARVSSSSTTGDASTVRVGRSAVLTYPEVDPEDCTDAAPPCYGGRIADVEAPVTDAPAPCP